MVKCLVAHKDLETFDSEKVRKAWEGRGHHHIWWWRVSVHYGIKVIEVEWTAGIEVLAMTKPDFDRWRNRHGQG